ncbi:MAG: 2-hydroxychromene-2-carboxylate isomerase [Arenicellales bacterium]
MQKTVDYYHFLISPWSFLAIGRFNEIVARHDLKVHYKPIAVMPTFEKMGGVPPAKRHPSRQRLRMDELKRWSSYLDISMNFQPAFFPVDCGTASKMVIAAGNQDLNAGALSDAVLTAVWTEEKDVSDDSTLVEIANKCSLDGSALLAAANTDELATQFEAITNEAHAADVFGSPTYVLNGEIFWGQDRFDFLERALTG